MPAQLKAIFFDVGNTLLFPDREHILAPLAKRGHSPTLAEWHAIERATKKEFDDIVAHGGPADHSFWFMFYERLLDQLEVEDDDVRDLLVESTRQSANWRVIRPGTRELLQRLGERYRLAVISNADGKIAEVLERCGIADCFASITDSGLVGYEKPHPVIFEAALRAMAVTPEASLYVGDAYSVDYLGATRAGMQGMLLDVAGAYRAMKVARVESLEELEKKLGAG
ncbi:MAG: HAD family hydrolase [Terriglobales bacterium]|jgi:HAD superfamily hydrolase (TIGR01549 family)